MSEVQMCPFERLTDEPARNRRPLLAIFSAVAPADLDACVRVCTAWRAFIGMHMVAGDKAVTRALVRAKMPQEWLAARSEHYIN